LHTSFYGSAGVLGSPTKDLNVRSARLAERLDFVCEKIFDEIIEREHLPARDPDLVGKDEGEARRTRLYVRVRPELGQAHSK
jgi:hypothetical protein